MIKMAELKKTFEALGFENVLTYINSGNIAFDSTAIKENKLIEMIEKAIEKDFGFMPQTMLRQQSAIARIIAVNPFDGQFESHKEMHVLFMKEEMSADIQDQLLAAQTDDERFAVIGREIYCHLKLGVADSLLGKGFIEKKLKTSTTGRNWRTVNKLVSM